MDMSAADEPQALPPDTSARIDAWFVDLIHNSPVSRDTEVFNHVRRAVDELKRRLTEEM